ISRQVSANASGLRSRQFGFAKRLRGRGASAPVGSSPPLIALIELYYQRSTYPPSLWEQVRQ
ncbi:MAG: hypothetical protein AAGK38_12585, partial [Pseudomonadota bacterium]